MGEGYLRLGDYKRAFSNLRYSFELAREHGLTRVEYINLEFDEEADAELVRQSEEIQERGSLALYASGAITDDAIIDPRDTRTVLGICLSAVKNAPLEGAEGYGVFRL